MLLRAADKSATTDGAASGWPAGCLEEKDVEDGSFMSGVVSSPGRRQ